MSFERYRRKKIRKIDKLAPMPPIEEILQIQVLVKQLQAEGELSTIESKDKIAQLNELVNSADKKWGVSDIYVNLADENFKKIAKQGKKIYENFIRKLYQFSQKQQITVLRDSIQPIEDELTIQSVTVSEEDVYSSNLTAQQIKVYEREERQKPAVEGKGKEKITEEEEKIINDDATGSWYVQLAERLEHLNMEAAFNEVIKNGIVSQTKFPINDLREIHHYLNSDILNYQIQIAVYSFQRMLKPENKLSYQDQALIAMEFYIRHLIETPVGIAEPSRTQLHMLFYPPHSQPDLITRLSTLIPEEKDLLLNYAHTLLQLNELNFLINFLINQLNQIKEKTKEEDSAPLDAAILILQDEMLNLELHQDSLHDLLNQQLNVQVKQGSRSVETQWEEAKPVIALARGYFVKAKERLNEHFQNTETYSAALKIIDTELQYHHHVSNQIQECAKKAASDPSPKQLTRWIKSAREMSQDIPEVDKILYDVISKIERLEQEEVIDSKIEEFILAYHAKLHNPKVKLPPLNTMDAKTLLEYIEGWYAELAKNKPEQQFSKHSLFKNKQPSEDEKLYIAKVCNLKLLYIQVLNTAIGEKEMSKSAQTRVTTLLNRAAESQLINAHLSSNRIRKLFNTASRRTISKLKKRAQRQFKDTHS